MRVAVTGATGFLGRYVALRLQARGDTVIGSGRDRAAGAALERIGIAFAPAALDDAPAVDALIAGCDAVVHSGGLTSNWGPRAAFVAANVTGTRNVLASMRRHRVPRLVHISSPSIYFAYRDRIGLREDAPLPPPVNAYAATKRIAEDLVRAAGDGGLDAIVLRPRAIVGPGDRALLPRVVRVARRGRLPLIDGGRALIDLTYVDNVVDAIVSALDAPAAPGARVYNLTNGEPRSVAATFTQLIELLGLRARHVAIPFALAFGAAAAMEAVASVLPGRPEPPLTRYSVGVLGKSQTLDIRAARRELGYVPRVGLDEGFERIAAAWAKRG